MGKDAMGKGAGNETGGGIRNASPGGDQKSYKKEYLGSLSWFSIYTRPIKDVRARAMRVGRDMEQIKELKKRREEDLRLAHQALAGLSASERFEMIARLNRWTEPELRAQLVAVHRTRLMLMGMAGIILLLCIYVLAVAPLWSLVLLLPISVLVPAVIAALSMKYAWHEWELVNRKTIPFGVFRKMGMGVLMRMALTEPLPQSLEDARQAQQAMKDMDVGAIEELVAQRKREQGQ